MDKVTKVLLGRLVGWSVQHSINMETDDICARSIIQTTYLIVILAQIIHVRQGFNAGRVAVDLAAIAAKHDAAHQGKTGQSHHVHDEILSWIHLAVIVTLLNNLRFVSRGAS